jgi:Na+/H+-dicarboxylate symporter
LVTTGHCLKPLGDAFIKLIKMMIAPVVFCTIVTGIAGMSDKRSLGRLLSKTLLLFLALTVISLIIGLVSVYLFKPGVGMNIDPSVEHQGAVQYTDSAAKLGVVEFFMHIIPDTFIGAFNKGEVLPVLFIAVLCGLPSRLSASAASRYWIYWKPPRTWCSRSSPT